MDTDMKAGYIACFVFFMVWIDGIHSNEREEIMVPMCKGLVDYTHTKLPNDFNHTTQAQVYRALVPLWSIMDSECSRNIRTLICSVYLPKVTEDGQIVKPCRKTCFWAKRRCSGRLRRAGMKWNDKLKKCGPLPRKNREECIRPVPERFTRRNPYEGYCQRYSMPMCQYFNNNQWLGSLPNLFHQTNESLIERELQQYQLLIDSGCHDNLLFLLCATFKPRCLSNDHTHVMPCQEVCEQVKNSCTGNYSQIYGGVQWNAKLECHRYPSSALNQTCVTPDTFNED